MKKIPALSLPSKVVLVDDNQSFLNMLKLELDSCFDLDIFTNAENASDFIKSSSYLSDTLSNSFQHVNLDEADIDIHHPIFDFNALSSIIYNENRFTEVSVIVSDYLMPGQVNGIELCGTLSDLPLRKVILTGEADNQTAIDAFNEGVINKFLVKDNDGIISRVKETVFNEKQLFFNDLSSSVPAWKFANNKSAEYSQVFDSILKKYNIVEFYQVNQSDYLLMDADANIFWLVFHTDEQKKYYIEVAEDHEEDDIVNKLQSGEYVVFLHSEKEKGLPVDQWKNYIFPVSGTVGECTYSVIEDRVFSLDQERIISYNDYLKSLN